MKNITEIGVFVGSPSDLSVERAVVRQAIEELKFSENGKEFRLVPIMWEEAIPDIGSYPQEVINRQLIDESDIFIFMFHVRLGTATPNADSGTLEELDLAINAALAEPNAKGVSVFFSGNPIAPHSIDVEQLKKLQEFRKGLSERKILSQDFIGNENLKEWVTKTLAYHLKKISKFLFEDDKSAENKKKVAAITIDPNLPQSLAGAGSSCLKLAISTNPELEVDANDDGDGILDSISLFEECMQQQVNAMQIVAETTTGLGSRISDQTKKIDTLKKLNIVVDNATLKSISDGVAAVLEQWNEKVGPETEKLGPRAFEGIVALENSLHLINHSDQLDSIPPEFYDEVISLVEVISQVQPSIEGLRTTLAKTPPLTKKLRTQLKKAIVNLEVFEEFMRASKVSYARIANTVQLLTR